jgi:hypothetical protein
MIHYYAVYVFCNISSYDILAYITKNYMALIDVEHPTITSTGMCLFSCIHDNNWVANNNACRWTSGTVVTLRVELCIVTVNDNIVDSRKDLPCSRPSTITPLKQYLVYCSCYKCFILCVRRVEFLSLRHSFLFRHENEL